MPTFEQTLEDAVRPPRLAERRGSTLSLPPLSSRLDHPGLRGHGVTAGALPVAVTAAVPPPELPRSEAGFIPARRRIAEATLRACGVDVPNDPAGRRGAWRALVRRMHPDHGGDPEQFSRACEAFREIAAADC